MGIFCEFYTVQMALNRATSHILFQLILVLFMISAIPGLFLNCFSSMIAQTLGPEKSFKET